MKWKHVPNYWSFVKEIYLSPVDSSHTGQTVELRGFGTLMCCCHGYENRMDSRHNAVQSTVHTIKCTQFRCAWCYCVCIVSSKWIHLIDLPISFMVVLLHYDDVTMGAIASQITSLTIVYSTVYSGADQSKHQSSASLAFVWGIHRGPVNSPHKWPVTRKMFPFDDVIMDMGIIAWYPKCWDKGKIDSYLNTTKRTTVLGRKCEWSAER